MSEAYKKLEEFGRQAVSFNAGFNERHVLTEPERIESEALFQSFVGFLETLDPNSLDDADLDAISKIDSEWEEVGEDLLGSERDDFGPDYFRERFLKTGTNAWNILMLAYTDDIEVIPHRDFDFGHHSSGPEGAD